MYNMPILCPYEVFANGLKALRLKQGAKQSKNVQDLTPKQITKRYAGQIRTALKGTVKPPRKREILLIPVSCKVHDLRALYMSFVYECFTWMDDTFQRGAMRILGHSCLQESLSYGRIRLSEAEALRGKFGDLRF